MDKVRKQRGSIVLHKDRYNGEECIRVDYADSQAITLLLAQDTDVVAIEDGSGYIPAAAFRLPDFYDRYSPHAYIDYSLVYVRHPKPKREYTLPKGYLELLEQKRYSPSTVKTYRAYFSDFMEYHKGRNIDRLKVPDINKYILYLVNEKKISVSQQNMRINAIKFYYEQVRGGKRQYYGGITRAKEYKSLPEVLSRNEVRRILSCLANRKHRCMISLIYSAGLRRSELLNLTPQDIMSERMLIRIMGKGKKMPLLAAVGEGIVRTSGIFQGISPAKMAVRGRNTRRAIFGKCIGESVEGSRRSCRHQAPGTRTHAPPLLCHSPAGAGNGPPHHSGASGTQRHQDYEHISPCHKHSQIKHTKSP